MSSKSRPPNNGGSDGRHNLSPKSLPQIGHQVAAPLTLTLGAPDKSNRLPRRGYRFFFVSLEEDRMHVHVRSSEGAEAHRDELTAAWQGTSGIEVTDLWPHGIWVLPQREEIFLPYENFPCSRRGRLRQCSMSRNSHPATIIGQISTWIWALIRCATSIGTFLSFDARAQQKRFKRTAKTSLDLLPQINRRPSSAADCLR